MINRRQAIKALSGGVALTLVGRSVSAASPEPVQQLKNVKLDSVSVDPSPTQVRMSEALDDNVYQEGLDKFKEAAYNGLNREGDIDLQVNFPLSLPHDEAYQLRTCVSLTRELVNAVRDFDNLVETEWSHVWRGLEYTTEKLGDPFVIREGELTVTERN